MPHGRGNSEIMSSAVSQAEEKSYTLTAANVIGFRITVCPIEGKIVSGEVRFFVPKCEFNDMYDL